MKKKEAIRMKNKEAGALAPPQESLRFDLTLRTVDIDEGYEGEGREIATIIKKQMSIKELKYFIENIKSVLKPLDIVEVETEDGYEAATENWIWN